MRKITILTLLLMCSGAQAAEWVSLGKSEDGTLETFVDVSSVRVQGQVRKAWFKRVNTPPAELRGKRVNESLIHRAFKCADETSIAESATLYFTDGTNSNASADTIWSPITPETFGEAEFKFVCALKPK